MIIKLGLQYLRLSLRDAAVIAKEVVIKHLAVAFALAVMVSAIGLGNVGTASAEQKVTFEVKNEEHRIKQESNRTGLKQWAEENYIDLQYVMLQAPGGMDKELEDALEYGESTDEQRYLVFSYSAHPYTNHSSLQ